MVADFILFLGGMIIYLDREWLDKEIILIGLSFELAVIADLFNYLNYR